MNWTKISAISDVVVAISVIVSLVYVANQLDQNTKALQLSGVISTTEMWTEQQILLAENGELNAIFWKGMSGDGSTWSNKPLHQGIHARGAAFSGLFVP